jgi:hypothetical protein
VLADLVGRAQGTPLVDARHRKAAAAPTPAEAGVCPHRPQVRARGGRRVWRASSPRRPRWVTSRMPQLCDQVCSDAVSGAAHVPRTLAVRPGRGCAPTSDITSPSM